MRLMREKRNDTGWGFIHFFLIQVFFLMQWLKFKFRYLFKIKYFKNEKKLESIMFETQFET